MKLNQLLANDSFDIFVNDEPPAKKRRGANVKYEFVEEVETSDDLKQKANVAGVKQINTQNGNVYYECKIPSCCYKWKAKKTDEFKYLIYEIENAHDHENAERKTGLTKYMKDIVDKRMITQSLLYDNEFTCNCPIGALRIRCKHVLLIQIMCNHRQWPNMPALRQTINRTARNRQGRPRLHTPALSRT